MKSDKLRPKKKGGGQGGAVVRRKFNSLKPIIYELKDLIFIVIYGIGNLTCNNVFCMFQESNNTFSLKSLSHEAMAGNM